MSSLDALRGLAIFGMLLVDNPGNGQLIYAHLQHSDWHGCTAADLLFPCFLFVLGASLSFSFSKWRSEKSESLRIIAMILHRSICLFVLGLAINGFPYYDLNTLRLMGVLQRVGMVYLLASLCILCLPRSWLWSLATAALIGYWVSIRFIAAPGYAAGDLSAEASLAGYIDRTLLGRAHLHYGADYDPEGLLATLPASVTALIGYITIEWVRLQAATTSTAVRLGLAGLAGILLGCVWSLDVPLNKSLWTSSYVAFTTGWSLVFLALCYEIGHVFAWRKLSNPLEVLGKNAIIVFIGSILLERCVTQTTIGVTLRAWMTDVLLTPLAGPKTASLLYALITALGWWLFAYVLHRRRIFVRI